MLLVGKIHGIPMMKVSQESGKFRGCASHATIHPRVSGAEMQMQKALINIELAIKKHWFKSKSDARKNAGKVKPCMIVFIYIYIDYMFNS